ncbi:hypothetical protein UFOVP256_57 [uncultured Caudovirales phage]|uniref:Uncharacterized protein n=1 Tax=uncultured Caudovirales phage TaxID=2100421 RepID=A0A6J5LEY2_9CAUD|nr:hypothetical protein UFOVP256_57 [uncultured Caudovirales phage]
MIEYNEKQLERLKKAYINDVEKRIESSVNDEIPEEIYIDALANLLIKKLILKNVLRKFVLVRIAAGYDYHCAYLNENLSQDEDND